MVWDPADGLATVTHARVRAAQGDLEGARRILRKILGTRPGDPEARDLLDRLADRIGAPERDAEDEPPLAPPQAGDPSALRDRFRGALGAAPGSRRAASAERLRALLRRIERNRGGDHAG